MPIPDHKLVILPCESESEVHFACSLLGSSISKYIVSFYAITTSISTNVLDYIPIPKYESANTNHGRLADFSKNAHRAISIGDEIGIKEFEQGIDELVAEVWGLTKDELKEIQESLADLAK